MQNLNLIQHAAICILPILLAITMHEAAHAIVAFLLGDKTAYASGRVSLDPFKHIDLMGTVLFPVLCLLSGMGIIFGWAKPVPIDSRNFKNIARDEALVLLAGPFSNFIMAFLWGGIFKLLTIYPTLDMQFSGFFSLMCQAGVMINIMLGFFNLLPIPTFDGGVVLRFLMPIDKYISLYSFFRRYGVWIILLLIYTKILTFILLPLVKFGILCVNLFYGL